MSASYNNSAWFYDRLSRLVYGRALINAQAYLLKFIPANATVLIVGGGTGWILEELTKVHPSGLQITYVEVAADMMARSRQRKVGQHRVTFINDAVENVYPDAKFDVVLTPFLFDNFIVETTDKVFCHLHQLLKLGGIWLNCDFQLTGKWWQAVLLKSMFFFFRLICEIEASKLPDVQSLFSADKYLLLGECTFYRDFVGAKVYRKV
jgi:ubiquinone/menaquinone biosynthesis C-methylase UbiE